MSTHEPLGALDRSHDAWRLEFVRDLPHPPERVWRAVTEPTEIAAWFPTSIEGDRSPGAELRFTFPRDEAPPFSGVMLGYEEHRLIEFTWGGDLLRITLEPVGDGTRLTLSATLDERGKAARDGAGWHVCLAALERHLDPIAGLPEVEWPAVHPEYVASFGPEASTIGPPDGT